MSTGDTDVDADVLYECPDCKKITLTPYQRQNGYHCDACTREADPEGYRNEVMGFNDQSDYYITEEEFKDRVLELLVMNNADGVKM